MEYIIIILISLIFIILLKKIFNIKISVLKNYKEDEKLIKITDKFPNNMELTKEVLEKLKNETVKVKENADSETSLYVALTNTISISTKKNSCTRIQTIAHECVHSVQNRIVQVSNFIISNVYIIYFFTILVLTIFNLINNPLLYLNILILLGTLQLVIRVYLEMDAMIKAKYVAKEYMQEKKLISKEEIDVLCDEYDKINKIGIPFYVWNLFTSNMVKIIIYTVIVLI